MCSLKAYVVVCHLALRFGFRIVSVCALTLSLLFSVVAHAQDQPVVRGLFKNTAIVQINGKQRMLKLNRPSPEGLLLKEANSKFAMIEYQGEIKKYTLSSEVGGAPMKEPTSKQVRLQKGDRGHYYADGKINGRSVRFMVDTGASAIAMDRSDADRLGLQYKDGRRVLVNTANGQTVAYKISLTAVQVGTIVRNYVDALIMEKDGPRIILLGNSFLSQVNYSTEGGLMVLEAKY